MNQESTTKTEHNKKMLPSSGSLWTRGVIAWALFDFANTIWSFAIATRYLNDWLLVERGEADWKLGAAAALASIFLVCTLPYWGALSDAKPIRVRLLGIFVAVCCTATALMGVTSSLATVLLLSALATYCFQAALAQYDPLLRQVAPPDKEGVVSGIGVGVGYMGVLFALPVLALVVGDGSSQKALPVAAVLFAILALPCLLLVKSPRPKEKIVVPRFRDTIRTTWDAVQAARTAPWGRFLVARFLYSDAVATVIGIMTVFASRVGGLEDGQVNKLLAGSIVPAVVGAFGAGTASKKFGPKPVLMAAVSLGAITMLLAGAAGQTWLLWVCGPMCGLVLAAVNTADRALMLALVGDHPSGEPFGVYALIGKLSSGIGPLII